MISIIRLLSFSHFYISLAGFPSFIFAFLPSSLALALFLSFLPLFSHFHLFLDQILLLFSCSCLHILHLFCCHSFRYFRIFVFVLLTLLLSFSHFTSLLSSFLVSFSHFGLSKRLSSLLSVSHFMFRIFSSLALSRSHSFFYFTVLLSFDVIPRVIFTSI